ncbi:MAG: hypothetical protein LBT00_08915 [Spirochaetaceae bacterium]|jgi:TusA-related sulfurtransferase|nr:hypothetical protein [Spirochaetaceae bacterium]
MNAEDNDPFVKLGLLMEQNGYVIVSYETNGEEIRLLIKKNEKKLGEIIKK